LFPRWLKWPLFAAFIGLVLAVCVSAEMQEAKIYNQRQPAQTDNANKQPGNSTANPSSAEHPKERGQESHWYDSLLNHLTDWLLVLFNGILAIFTVRLFYNAAEQARDTKAAIAVADRTAKAAERNAKTAELALLSVEIPYLYPYVRTHGINVEVVGETETPQIKSFDYGNEFITYYFKNFGRTPAEIIEVFSVIHLGMGHPPPITVPSVPFIRLSGVVVADGGESENFPRDLTEHMYQTIYRRGFNPEMDLVWFSGYARYRDVFQNEYVAVFCLAFSPRDGKFYPMGGEGYNYRKKTKSAGEMTPNSSPPPAI
jgi:hypothetical protein